MEDCKTIEWFGIESCPQDGTPFYVWMPKWNSRGPMVRTKFTSYFWNDLLNGSAPWNFQPKHWTPIPEEPKSQHKAT